MRILSGEEAQKAVRYIEDAATAAAYASCFRSKCGSVIVKNDQIIGKGYNAPPLDVKLEYCLKDSLPLNFKSDKTCCMHAEQRAIMDALQHHPDKLPGSRLYFIRLDEQGQKKKSGDPYCTICSKFSLDAGIGEFVLWREEGLCVYDTVEYNELSFKFRG
ncbi:MAG: hypothetical protein Q7S55_04690 [Nanoarchaeota archaeon]|nr:hypothetical protein [Nanoarchaeota archaeon]